MYFPYFRGRQYELLALKELALRELITDKVVPVVEPIKISSTLNSTLKAYNDKNLPLAFIVNPEVGDYSDADTKPLLQCINGTIIPSIIVNDNINEAIENTESLNIDKASILAILAGRDFIDEYKDYFSDKSPKYTLFPDERQLRRTVRENKVIFEDKFNKQSKNAEYLKSIDEFFSDDHVYYSDEGYLGFGDYSIIGNNYEEGGFSPRAVAIHIVYFDDDNFLRVHHFVSDSNMGTEDVAGKFYEAVQKLEDWYNKGHVNSNTYALSILLDYSKQGYYPGLPTIKKLSIMHHLELVNKFLTEN